MTILPKLFWQKVDNVLLKVWIWWFFLQKAIVLQKVPLTVEEDSFVKPTEIFWQKESGFFTGLLKFKKNISQKKLPLLKIFWTHSVQIWKPRPLTFAKTSNVYRSMSHKTKKIYIGCSKSIHSVKIIKKQFWKSKLSYSNCFFSDDDRKFGTHTGKRSAKAEFFSLEVHKWRKKKLFSRKSLFFQMFNNSIRHVECTFGCHAKKIPQKGWKFFAKCVTMMRKCFWRQILFLKLLILAITSALLKSSQKTFYKTRKTPAQSRKMIKKVVFQNNIFSFHLTCIKHFWQSCPKSTCQKADNFPLNVSKLKK